MQVRSRMISVRRASPSRSKYALSQRIRCWCWCWRAAAMLLQLATRAWSGGVYTAPMLLIGVLVVLLVPVLLLLE